MQGFLLTRHGARIARANRGEIRVGQRVWNKVLEGGPVPLPGRPRR